MKRMPTACKQQQILAERWLACHQSGLAAESKPASIVAGVRHEMQASIQNVGLCSRTSQEQTRQACRLFCKAAKLTSQQAACM
jgi:hypothetical protein